MKNIYPKKFLVIIFSSAAVLLGQETGAMLPQIGVKPGEGKNSIENCTVVQWDKSLFAHPYLTIRQPGKYCIDQDYRLRCTNGTCGGGPLIEIIADNVDLDLQGHILSREGRPIEIFGRGFNISVRNGTVRNGSIRIRTPDTPNKPINSDKSMKEPTLKEDNFIRIENIHLEQGGNFRFRSKFANTQ